jgi:hypothetical protein
MIFVGIALLVIGGILIFVRISAQKKLFEIKATETFKAKDLQELYESVKADVGPGGFSKVLEIKGLSKSDNPLTSEIAKQQCVYYSMSVIREYEETYQEKDSNGNYVTKTRRAEDTISSNTQSIPFYVEDDTGKVLVNPNGASIDAQQVVDKFEPGERQAGASLSFGAFSITLSAPASPTRTLGYRFRESIIPLDRKLYVLGEATDTSGELAIQRPREKGKKFIVSMKSEEELVRSAESTIKWTLYAAIACDVIGVILIIVSILGKK